MGVGGAAASGRTRDTGDGIMIIMLMTMVVVPRGVTTMKKSAWPDDDGDDPPRHHDEVDDDVLLAFGRSAQDIVDIRPTAPSRGGVGSTSFEIFLASPTLLAGHSGKIGPLGDKKPGS